MFRKGITALSSMLEKTGWKLSGYNDIGAQYTKSFKHMRRGVQSFTVQISTRGGVSMESRIFSGCRLIGPSFSNGSVVPHSVIGEWATMRGAIKGITAKYETAYNAFLTREARFIEQCKR